MVQFILDDIGGAGVWGGSPEHRENLVLACVMSEMAGAPSSLLESSAASEGSSNSGPG